MVPAHSSLARLADAQCGPASTMIIVGTIIQYSLFRISEQFLSGRDIRRVRNHSNEMKIRVGCCSGAKLSQQPIKFWIGDNALFVESIEDQWRGADGIYFRLRADDGHSYILCHIEASEDWFLDHRR